MIKTPTLVINSEIAKNNIQRLAKKAQSNNLIFRPHFKTHQSAQVGEWFRELGISKITVSSLTMAQYFANHGWTDITVAFPLNILEIETIQELAKKITLNLLVESEESVLFLCQHLIYHVNIYLKIDTGYQRTGIAWNDVAYIKTLLQKITHSEKLNFSGFLAHAGHSYQAINKNEVLAIHSDTCQKMAALKVTFIDDYPELICSIGDTPSCSVGNEFLGIDEIRPGNFVYYDAMQLEIGSCTFENIAAAVACPVVAKHKTRMEIVVYGGGVHLSKEAGNHQPYGTHYGLVAQTNNQGWGNIVDGVFVKKLSQEHGIIQATPGFFEQTKIGDLMYIIPVHSCMAANLLKNNTTII